MRIVLSALIVLLGITAVADAGIFKPGKRYIFGWRRPDNVKPQPAPAPIPPPVLDDSLVGPSPRDEKIDAAIEAVTELIRAKDEPVVSAPEPEPEGGIPGWILPAITGLAGGGLGIRSALGDKGGS